MKKTDDNLTVEFCEELHHEIESTREEFTKPATVEHQPEKSVQVNPALVEASIQDRKKKLLFNRIARIVISSARER